MPPHPLSLEIGPSGISRQTLTELHNGIKVTFRICYTIFRQYPQKKTAFTKRGFYHNFLKKMFMPTKIPDIYKWQNNPLWQALAWDFHTCVINHTQMQVWRLAYVIWKLEINAKLITLSVLPIFWTIFKTLKQLLCAFIRVPGSFIDFNVYFKGLIQFHKLHFGKTFFIKQFVDCFL